MKGDEYAPDHLLALVRGLPPESRTISMLRGGEQFVGWGMDRYLMASLIDSVNATTHAVVSSNSKRKVTAPKPVRRPKKNPQTGSNNLFRQRLEQAKKSKGG